jgi:LacI family transcriptional regulator, galactose operon repressor
MFPKTNTPTIDDVARQAGVSISTVSRVLNRNVPVSEEVVPKVEAAMRALRYTPRAAARNLATQRTNTLGLLLAEIVGDFFSPLLSGIEEVAAQSGFDLLISTAGRRGPQDELPGPFNKHNADGLLIFAGSLTDEGVRDTHSLGVPMVLLHQSAPVGSGIPCVTIENKAATRAIVEHLIVKHNRRRILFLTGEPNNEDGHWREMGYREALTRHQIPIESALIAPGHFERRIAQASIEQLLREGIKFDGVFTGDDEAAVGVYAALRAAHLRIPEDVAVVGFDDQGLAQVLQPSLTTVHVPIEQVGMEAARQLIQLIHHGTAEPLTLLPTTLVIRSSCGCTE